MPGERRFTVQPDPETYRGEDADDELEADDVDDDQED
jgi:hypothetical protein